MKINVLPSPAGKVTELARSDEEKNKQRIIRYKEKKQSLEISSSVCSFVAATFPAGEGKEADPFTCSK